MKNEIRASGFTLIELLVAITIFSIVMGSVYSAFRVGIRSYRAQDERNYVNENYRNAWKQMSRDLRCAYVSASNKNIIFKGEQDTVLFTSYLSSVHSKNGGLGEIEYSIDDDPLTPETGLVRTCHGFPAGKREDRYTERQEIAPLAKSLKIEYYDGKAWDGEWDSSAQDADKQLPLKARITIQFVPDNKTTDEKILSFEVPVYAGALSAVN